MVPFSENLSTIDLNASSSLIDVGSTSLDYETSNYKPLHETATNNKDITENKKSVRFASPDSNEVQEFDIVPNSLEKDVWYSAAELNLIKMKRKMMGKMIRNKLRAAAAAAATAEAANEAASTKNGVIEIENETTCIRGLENLLDPDYNRRRCAVKRNSIRIVVAEYQRQVSNPYGFYDPDAIAALYLVNGSMHCRQNAYGRALQDAKWSESENNNNDIEEENTSSNVVDDTPAVAPTTTTQTATTAPSTKAASIDNKLIHCKRISLSPKRASCCKRPSQQSRTFLQKMFSFLRLSYVSVAPVLE